MTAVAVWDTKPDPDALLEFRLKHGWQPTPTLTNEGEKIMGHARCTTSEVG